MSFLEVALPVAFVVGVGVVAWWVTSCLTSRAEAPSTEQRTTVAQNFVRGAQLMGRCSAVDASSAKGERSDDDAEQRPNTADSTMARGPREPSKDDLREAVRLFNEGLRAYPNDFSTRFLKAQALEELGELNAALDELDWLLSQRGSVKPNFVRRMAVALGVLESRSVAPLGTSLVGNCEVDVVVFHLRKRKGRVLLKKRRISEAMQEFRLALNILDRMTWDEELQRREEQASTRMKALRTKSDSSLDKENEGSLVQSGPASRKANRGLSGSRPEDEAELLLERDYLSADETGLNQDKQAAKKAQKGSGLKIPYARAEIDLLLATCHETTGCVIEAMRCLNEAIVIGNPKAQEEGKVALTRLENNLQNGVKAD